MMKETTLKGLMTATINASFLLIGFAITIFGTTNNRIAGEHRMDIGQTGLLVTVMSAGRILAVIWTWANGGRTPGKPVLFCGILLMSGGLLGAGMSIGFPMTLACFFAAGFGHGLIDVSGSTLTSALHPERFGSALSSAHMYVGIGCLLGPLIAGTVLTYSDQWRIVYYIQGGLGILLLPAVALLAYPSYRAVPNEERMSGFDPFLYSGAFILLAMTIFLYSGSGHSLNAWINYYMLDVVRFPEFFAAGTLAVYNLGLTAGRLVCSKVMEKTGYRNVLLAGSIGALLSITASLYTEDRVIMVICLFLLGAFFGGLFPTTIAVARKLYPDRITAVTSVLVLAASIGSMTFPYATGLLSRAMGINDGLKLLIIPVSIIVPVTLYLRIKKIKRSN